MFKKKELNTGCWILTTTVKIYAWNWRKKKQTIFSSIYVYIFKLCIAWMHLFSHTPKNLWSFPYGFIIVRTKMSGWIWYFNSKYIMRNGFSLNFNVKYHIVDRFFPCALNDSENKLYSDDLYGKRSNQNWVCVTFGKMTPYVQFIFYHVTRSRGSPFRCL